MGPIASKGQMVDPFDTDYNPYTGWRTDIHPKSPADKIRDKCSIPEVMSGACERKVAAYKKRQDEEDIRKMYEGEHGEYRTCPRPYGNPTSPQWMRVLEASVDCRKRIDEMFRTRKKLIAEARLKRVSQWVAQQISEGKSVNLRKINPDRISGFGPRARSVEDLDAVKRSDGAVFRKNEVVLVSDKEGLTSETIEDFRLSDSGDTFTIMAWLTGGRKVNIDQLTPRSALDGNFDYSNIILALPDLSR